MADVLQPIIDVLPKLVAAVDAILAKQGNVVDPAEVAAQAAAIQAQADRLAPPAPAA